MKSRTALGMALSAGLVSALSLVAGTSHAKELVFGFIPNSMAFPYDVVLADGFKEKAAEKGVKGERHAVWYESKHEVLGVRRSSNE